MDNIGKNRKRNSDESHKFLMSKTVALLLYPPQIREMSARTIRNVIKKYVNVNILGQET